MVHGRVVYDTTKADAIDLGRQLVLVPEVVHLAVTRGSDAATTYNTKHGKATGTVTKLKGTNIRAHTLNNNAHFLTNAMRTPTHAYIHAYIHTYTHIYTANFIQTYTHTHIHT